MKHLLFLCFLFSFLFTGCFTWEHKLSYSDYYNSAVSSVNQQDYDSAISNLNSALQLNPTSTDAKNLLAQARKMKFEYDMITGTKRFNDHDFKSSIDYFQQALSVNPDDTDAKNMLEKAKSQNDATNQLNQTKTIQKEAFQVYFQNEFTDQSPKHKDFFNLLLIKNNLSSAMPHNQISDVYFNQLIPAFRKMDDEEKKIQISDPSLLAIHKLEIQSLDIGLQAMNSAAQYYQTNDLTKKQEAISLWNQYVSSEKVRLSKVKQYADTNQLDYPANFHFEDEINYTENLLYID